MASKTNFKDLSSDKGLAVLNTHLADKSYIEGYKVSQADFNVFCQVNINTVDGAKFPHVVRWHNHINSYSPLCKKGSECAKSNKAAPKSPAKSPAQGPKSPAQGPKSPAQGPKSPAQGPKSPAKSPAQGPAKKKSNADEDLGDPFAEEEIDPFEVTEEDGESYKKIAQIAKEKMEKDKKAGKKKELARSTLILDIKPEDDETDMVQLEKAVRGITMKGLDWRGSELVPIFRDLKKLRIICVIVDDDVPYTDVVTEEIEKLPRVQSTDVYAFNKV